MRCGVFLSVIGVIMVLVQGSFLTMNVASLDDATSNLHVTTNSALSSSSFVRSGNGSAASPLIISDWNMSGHYIRIENTDLHVIIKNITFGASGSWAFYLVNANNLIIENVTSTDRGLFLYSSGCDNIRFDHCNVTGITTQTYVVRIVNGLRFTISNSRFVRKDQLSSAAISFDNQGSNQVFSGNYLEGIPFEDGNFRGDGLISNCTFIDSPVTLTDGAQGGTVRSSTFLVPGGDCLTLLNCDFMTIEENAFTGDQGIYFYSGAWSWTSTYGSIENNTFVDCDKGIGVRNNWQVRPSHYNVHHNYFGNCSTYAIDWGNGMSNRMWHNIFYHNAGTDNVTTGSQCKQANWGQAAYKNSWTWGDIGNFWANHQTPDDDHDGIVDIPYTITTGGSDTRPSANPFFDTELPSIRITSPTTLYPGRSYIVMEWEASDDNSGVDRIDLGIDDGPWSRVENVGSCSIFLKKGSHFVHLRATDRAGLFDTTTTQFILQDTYDVMDIEQPADRSYLSSQYVDVAWSVADYFEVRNQSITIDGETTYLDPLQRVYRPTLPEGLHSLSISIRDEYGKTFTENINFTIDLTDPQVIIDAPQSGSTLSNRFVHFSYGAEDNFGLMHLDIRFDEGDWQPRPLQETSYSTLFEDGNHTLEIRAVDLSGREALRRVSFSIGDTPLLRFLKPPNGTATRESIMEVTWDYDGPFIWNHSYIQVGRSGEFEEIFDQRTLNITLTEDGEYELTLRLVDSFQNYIETSHIIIKDTTPPIVDFISPERGSLVNSDITRIEWRGRDNDDMPISAYLISLDEGDWMDMGTNDHYETSLSEGEHVVRVRAVDIAGNIAENQMSFTVDRTSPMLRFIFPENNSVLADSRAEFRFEASDDNELVLLNLSIDGARNISVLGKSSHLTTIGTDGVHSVTLMAVDGAGNTASVTLTLIVDLTEPVLQWVIPPEGAISTTTATISWTIMEERGVVSLSIEVDGSTENLDPGVRNYTLELTEGLHFITLKARDSAGWETILTTEKGLLVDLKPPRIMIDESRTKVRSNSVEIFWSSVDEGSGICRTIISLDGGEEEEVLSDGIYTFEGLSPGDHWIVISVIDRADNRKDVNWTFSVSIDTESEPGDGGGLDITLIAVICVIIFVIFLIIIGIFALRKRRREEEEEKKRRKQKMGSKPGRIKLNIPAAQPADGIPPNMVSLGDLPPTSAPPRMESTETGTGYIRPERKKKRKEKKVMEIPESEEEASGISDTPESTPHEESSPDVREGSDSKEEGVEENTGPGSKPHSKLTNDEEEEMEELEEVGEQRGVSGKVPEDVVLWDEDEDEDLEELEELEEFDELEDWGETEELDGEEEIEEWG